MRAPIVFAVALVAFALVALAVPPQSATGQTGWSERRIAALDATLLVHDKLRPLPVRDAPASDVGRGARQVARWQWPHAKRIFVAIETRPLAAGKPLTALLEEMDGKPRPETREDGLPAIRTELIFEGTLERRFWIHDRARGRAVIVSIAILGVDDWMRRKPRDIHRAFADPLWVPTKMFRSIRFAGPR